MNNKSSSIVNVETGTLSAFDPVVTTEQQAQDSRDFISSEIFKRMKEFKIAAEILLQNQKNCEQFKERDGL
jgi:hypothetical protein